VRGPRGPARHRRPSMYCVGGNAARFLAARFLDPFRDRNSDHCVGGNAARFFAARFLDPFRTLFFRHCARGNAARFSAACFLDPFRTLTFHHCARGNAVRFFRFVFARAREPKCCELRSRTQMLRTALENPNVANRAREHKCCETLRTAAVYVNASRRRRPHPHTHTTKQPFTLKWLDVSVQGLRGLQGPQGLQGLQGHPAEYPIEYLTRCPPKPLKSLKSSRFLKSLKLSRVPFRASRLVRVRFSFLPPASYLSTGRFRACCHGCPRRGAHER
jgi:hypothetical protein